MAFKGPYPTKFSGNTDAMVISATTFSGGVTNAGTIGPGGVTIISSTFLSGGFLNSNVISSTRTGIGIANATINGAIVDSGTISATSNLGILVSTGGVVSGGVAIGSHGKIFAGKSAVAVEFTPTFGGGISNAGTLSANNGIFVTSVEVFGDSSVGGGVTNTGTIAALSSGILVGEVASFSGGINNRGVISAGIAAST